jgi:predicted alpha/beta-hydrolase family hydrolase
MTDLLRDGPKSARLRLVLAHGAGAGMESPFMRDVARGLAALGVHVVRFEFPYMARRRSAGKARAAPDRAPVLLESYREVVAQLKRPETLFIGGKSMGGRMASMVADELGVRGLVCLGYPFHPPGKPAQTRTEHLKALETRALIVQGTRDPFGTKPEVAKYQLSRRIRLHWIEDGDHSLAVPKRSGKSAAHAMQEVLDAIGAFMKATK